MEYDFSGWATRNDIKCCDGRTIRHGAFKECDGITVPLVWSHDHNDPTNVLGHALLENRDEGVYAFCSFNDTDKANDAKESVKHGDITHLSIYANQLKQVGGDVLHGAIREVSLVLAGANPGALIDNVLLHGEESDEEAVIYNDDSFGIELAHSEDSKEDDMADEAKKPETKAENDETVKEVYDTMNEKQKTVVEIIVAAALEEANKKGSDSEEGEEKMKHNVFENDTPDNTLMHDGLNAIMADGKRFGSLKESFLAHAAEYGIENIEFINTEDHDVYDRPQFINTNPIAWVDVVMAGVHNTPFAKIRMTFADITEDEARAKGYIKGKYKKEEVFKLLRRSVGPTTIYKKQKFDRDDLIDAEFDVVPWIKQEMNIKFNEEKARAYIFGDGRSAADEDKVKEDCIIPVVADEDLYSIKYPVTPAADETLEHALITSAVLAQDDYQGSGNTTGFFEQKQVSKMLLMEDKFGHRLYKDINDLAAAMGVGKIVKVPASVVPSDVYGVIVDLNDYHVGMKNAGRTNFFDDFDIDYNQTKYLMETRQSGALVRPFSAVVLKKAQ